MFYVSRLSSQSPVRGASLLSATDSFSVNGDSVSDQFENSVLKIHSYMC